MSDLFIHRRADISDDGLLRFTLERIWDKDLPRLCYIGHNPAKADRFVDDPTVLRWGGFGAAWGFGGYVALNKYPFRAADPGECRRWLRSRSYNADVDIALETNLTTIRDCAKDCQMVVACWGNIGDDGDWTAQIIDQIDAFGRREIHCFGMNGNGTPRHPMSRGRNRVPDNQRPVVWRPA